MRADGLPADFEPTFLPPWLYDAATAQGYDMRYYARLELIPAGTFAQMTMRPGYQAAGSVNGYKAMISRNCVGTHCLPGLGGKCVVCGRKRR